MSESFGNYIKGIEGRLQGLPTPRRIAFAVWCCSILLKEYGPFLRSIAGKEAIDAVSRAMDVGWRLAESGERPAAAVLDVARNACARKWWSEDAEFDERLMDGGIELLECASAVLDCIDTGAASRAARAAECVLNCVDYRLTMIEDVRESLSHPKMVMEFERQRKMLDFLQGSAALSSAQRGLFRDGQNL